MNDDFENQLGRIPRRTAPPAWRAEIMTAASSATPKHSPFPETGRSSAPGFMVQLRAWLGGISPAWRMLAAVWALCLTVNHLTNNPTYGALAARGELRRLAPEQIAAARAQRTELLLLAGLADPEPPAPPRQRAPRPHSSLRRSERPACG